MENMKPCPFCGGEDIGISRIYIDPILPDSPPDEVYVGCNSCGIGYTEESEKEVIELWNTRKFKELKGTDASE